MRHRKSGAKLNRTSSHRKAMFRNMVTSLFKHDRIRTTDTKAKELRGWADHIITLAKRGDLHARRQALSIIREKDVVHKLFDEVSNRFGNVSGGYTRVIKLGRRPGDAAPVSLIELVTDESRDKKKSGKKSKPTAAKKAESKPKEKQSEAVEARKTAEAAEDEIIAAEAQNVDAETEVEDAPVDTSTIEAQKAEAAAEAEAPQAADDAAETDKEKSEPKEKGE